MAFHFEEKKLTVLQEAVQDFSKNEQDKFGVPEIKDPYTKAVVGQLLENTFASQAGDAENVVSVDTLNSRLTAMNESTAAPINMTTGVKNFDPVLVKMVRRAMPQLMAFDIAGVQPMKGPTGLIFAMRARYGTQTGVEALHNEANTAWSGARNGVHQGDSSGFNKDFIATGVPAADSKYGTGLLLSAAEILGTTTGDAWNEMAISIESTDVAAKSRKLKATYSRELKQDMAAIHNLSIDDELTNVLTAEVVAELDREMIRTINFSAVLGAQGTARPGIYDLVADADGRYFAERIKHLLFFIETEANNVAKRTRRGRANRIICSSNVASAFKILGILDNNSRLVNGMMVDETKQTYAGVLLNTYQVWIDPYSQVDYITLAYKGQSAWDAGVYYCPYIPLERLRATSADDFTPKLGINTRYGMVANPYFSKNADGSSTAGKGLGQGENGYFTKFAIANLTLAK